ncbi:unnamed protein product, partial [Didymodactylos carnosus]
LTTTTIKAHSTTLCATSSWNQTDITVAGGNGRGSVENQLGWTYDLALDSKQNLYVADNGNQRIQKYCANNSSPPLTLMTVGWLTVVFIDKYDNLYYAVNSFVYKLNMTSGVETIVAGNGVSGVGLNFCR